MAGPQTVDTIVDGSTTSHAITLLWAQRAVVGPAFYNAKSDLYAAGTNVAAQVLNAANDTGQTGALVLVPPSITQMVPPAAPTVTVNGTAQTTSYTYFVLALNAASDVVASLPTTITNGNATLNVTNFNAVSWGSVTNATSYKLVRSLGGATQGVIATQAGTSFSDQGATAVAFAYPNTNLTTLPQNLGVLDMRYLPTVGTAITRPDSSNTSQAGLLEISQRFDVGNGNGSVLHVDAFLTGGAGSGLAAFDAESVAIYGGMVRSAGTRSGWAANFLVTTQVAPSATYNTIGLEIDFNNNSGTDATATLIADGLVVLSGGTQKPRFGIHVGPAGSSPAFLIGMQIDGGAASANGLIIQSHASNSLFIRPANDLAANAEMFGSNAANSVVVWQVNNDGSSRFANVQANNQLYPGSGVTAGSTQTNAGVLAGSGVPTNAVGNNGDIYIRSDGTSVQTTPTTIYQRRAGVWVAVA